MDFGARNMAGRGLARYSFAPAADKPSDQRSNAQSVAAAALGCDAGGRCLRGANVEDAAEQTPVVGDGGGVAAWREQSLVLVAQKSFPISANHLDGRGALLRPAGGG